ncbi:Nn.00g004950.m01.CDS01 [Neocucurbitaria sp. VM-36]
MHRLLQTRLASLVCPSAPFLAPRLLRTTVPIVAASLPSSTWATGSPRSHYATHAKGKAISRKPSRIGKHGKKPRPAAEDATASLVTQFRQACETRNVQRIMDLYPSLLEAGALHSYDTRRITQALHVRMRNIHALSKSSDLFPFVQQVTTDIRRGALPPHTYAFVHLLGIYKDSKRFHEGYELWQWLVQQDEQYVSQAAYGAAIELMAYGGIMGLPDLENLYADGLKRFPGTFAEYHLSPEAIVPDRTQPTVIAGIPTILLQGILTARILARDWKKAYLALDTALRLFPTQTPPRYFELFMAERPLPEAYTACMIACRAGVCLAPTHITALITKIRAAIAASPSMADRMMLVRAIANALYAYMQAGGRLESIHVGVFIHTFEQLLPEQIAGVDYEGEAAELRSIIVVAAHEIMSGLIQAGMPLHVHSFEALISLAGKLRFPGLLTTALQDVRTAGLELGPIGTRSAITSAGLVGNKEIIEQLWERVVSAAEAESTQIPFQDWITFTKACRRAKHSDYFRAQLLKLPHAISASIEKHLIHQIDQPESVAMGFQSFHYMTPEDFLSEIDALKTQLKSVEAVLMSGQALDLSKSPFHMHIDPQHPTLGSATDLRAIYDEMTTDPHQPPAPPLTEGSPVRTSLSPTGIPLDELRFQNWCTVLEMMDDAEVYESDFQLALNAAIQERKPFKRGPELLRLRRDKSASLGEAGSLRCRITNLRAAGASDVPISRKVDFANE